MCVCVCVYWLYGYTYISSSTRCTRTSPFYTTPTFIRIMCPLRRRCIHVSDLIVYGRMRVVTTSSRTAFENALFSVHACDGRRPSSSRLIAYKYTYVYIHIHIYIHEGSVDGGSLRPTLRTSSRGIRAKVFTNREIRSSSHPHASRLTPSTCAIIIYYTRLYYPFIIIIIIIIIHREEGIGRIYKCKMINW